MRRMARALGLTVAAALGLIAANARAAAQEEPLYGAYCGQVTWEGRAPVDAWIIFLRGSRWNTPSAGAFGEALGGGPMTQEGTSLVMRSDRPPHFVLTTTARNGRITGTVTSDRAVRGAVSLAQMQGAEAGLSSSPIPPDFVPRRAQEVLAGQWDGLNQVMTWAWTPQGSGYWRRIFNNGPPLPPEAADALRDWIRRAEAGEQPRCPL